MKRTADKAGLTTWRESSPLHSQGTLNAQEVNRAGAPHADVSQNVARLAPGCIPSRPPTMRSVFFHLAQLSPVQPPLPMLPPEIEAMRSPSELAAAPTWNPAIAPDLRIRAGDERSPPRIPATAAGAGHGAPADSQGTDSRLGHGVIHGGVAIDAMLPNAASMPASPPLSQATVAQPGPPGANSGGASAMPDDATLMAQTAEVVKSPSKWAAKRASLQGDDLVRFAMFTMLCVADRPMVAVYLWRARLDRMLETCLQALQVQRWPGSEPLASILIKLDLNEALARLLETDDGKKSLSHANDQGTTPLHVAASFRNGEAAKLILAFDDGHGTLRMMADNIGQIALHRAVISGARDIVALLLSVKGNEQRLRRTRDGMLPICAPLFNCADLAVLQPLLEDAAGEQLTTVFSKNAANLLMVAVKSGYTGFVRLLLGVRAVLPQQLAMLDKHGHSVLDIARSEGKVEMVALIENAMKEVAETLPSSTFAPFTTGSAVVLVSSKAPGEPTVCADPAMPKTPVPSPRAATPDKEDDTEL